MVSNLSFFTPNDFKSSLFLALEILSNKGTSLFTLYVKPCKISKGYLFFAITIFDNALILPPIPTIFLGISISKSKIFFKLSRIYVFAPSILFLLKYNSFIRTVPISKEIDFSIFPFLTKENSVEPPPISTVTKVSS